MRYVALILIFLIAVYFFTVLNFYDNGWQYVQPFLIVTLLVYYNIDNHWLYYTFAFIAGLFLDSFTGVFGLHTIIFLTIILLLRSLQLTLLTSKNILTIILLTILAFVVFWLFFYSANFIFNWEIYTFQQAMLLPMFKMFLVNIATVIFFHLLYFNFHTKKHERQSF